VTDLTSVDVDGIDLTYRTVGEAGLLVVLLLHALGEDSSDWNAVVEALAPANRVYSLDLRGHGGSSQPGAYSLELICSDVLEFLHALDLDDVFLIGHSLGGAVAYLVAAAEPKRVRLLVLEEPAPPLPVMPPREVPPRPDGCLSSDGRVVEAITKQRNDPDPAW
jgi:3-oxoadipate enol-lactonase